jgi:hypothetical protein
VRQWEEQRYGIRDTCASGVMVSASSRMMILNGGHGWSVLYTTSVIIPLTLFSDDLFF